MLDVTYLENNIGWVCFTYSDGGKFYFRTTLNDEELRPLTRGRTQEQSLFDLDKLKWRKLPNVEQESVTLEITADKPEGSPLDEFARKFI